MPKRPPETISHGSPWAWLPLSLLLSISVTYHVSDEFRFLLEPYLFLPLLTGWLASRFGARIIGLLMVLGLTTAAGAQFYMFDTLQVAFGMPELIYYLSLGTAAAFARPKWAITPNALLNKHWRWLRWLVPVALWLAVFGPHDLTWKIDWSHKIGFDPGIWILIILMAASFQWVTVRSVFQSICLRSDHKLTRIVITGLFVALAIVFLFHIDWRFDWLNLSLGFHGGWSLLIASAFLLTASGLVDWRYLIAFVVLFSFSDAGLTWLIDWVQSVTVAEPAVVSSQTGSASDLALETIMVTGSQRNTSIWPLSPDATYCIGAVLIATAIAPFWQHQDPALLRNRRTSVFLGLTLLLSIGAGALSRYGLFSPGLLGGVAFIAALVWRTRGMIAGPLIIFSLFMLVLNLVRHVEISGISGFDLIGIGLVVFPFAFFGLLANRYTPVITRNDQVAPRRSGIPAAIPEPPGKNE